MVAVVGLEEAMMMMAMAMAKLAFSRSDYPSAVLADTRRRKLPCLINQPQRDIPTYIHWSVRPPNDEPSKRKQAKLITPLPLF